MTMIRFLTTRFAVVLFLGFIAFTVNAETAAGVGVMRGQVNYCGQGGVDGMQVYIPGRQFVVITDKDGKFLFDRLPAGEYLLKFKLGERVFKHTTKAYVFQQRVSELNDIAFCGAGTASGTLSTPAAATAVPDAGAKATPAPAATLPATAPSSSPVTPPVTTKAQSAAPGACREGTVVNISNGTAECKNGKLQVFSCSKGHGDCDGKVENGCEIDLMNDNDNCGSCGNACSSLETCALGSC